MSSLQKPEPPSVTEQARPQQSEFFPHKSPFAWHEYAGAQKPPLQLVEQQLAPVVQAWPTALQPGPPEIAAQLFPAPPSVFRPAQLRVQHSAPLAQLVPKSLHWVLEHRPLVQLLVQQSVDATQLVPDGWQNDCATQMPLALQDDEQHSPPEPQS